MQVRRRRGGCHEGNRREKRDEQRRRRCWPAEVPGLPIESLPAVSASVCPLDDCRCAAASLLEHRLPRRQRVLLTGESLRPSAALEPVCRLCSSRIPRLARCTPFAQPRPSDNIGTKRPATKSRLAALYASSHLLNLLTGKSSRHRHVLRSRRKHERAYSIALAIDRRRRESISAEIRSCIQGQTRCAVDCVVSHAQPC